MSGDNYYIGLMSGTSADAIDAVLVDLSKDITLIGHISRPLPVILRSEIHELSRSGANEIDRLGALDRHLGHLFATATLDLLEKTGFKPSQITAIGSHGQTIRHRPPGEQCVGFTLQIGDPNTIAEITGITTVADFRRRDMAAGGQGAPLVPAFHKAIFSSPGVNRVIVNIGGIANITWLPTNGDVIGFDTGPGNNLMDGWIFQHQGKNYDANGDWAASGKPHNELVSKLGDDVYFRLPAPKSSGRETFNQDWLNKILLSMDSIISPADVQASLLELTAKTIADDIKRLDKTTKGEVFVCGGGAFNLHLMTQLQAKLPAYTVQSTGKLGVAPTCVEGMAFAWLAQRTLRREVGNLCSVTGAKNEVILGGVYFA
jgi:anhydro-N-acetylmuramic acid kinase